MRYRRVMFGVVATLLCAGIPMGLQASGLEKPAGSEEQARIDGEWRPIGIGSVIGSGTLADGLCVFDTPIAVRGRSTSGEQGRSIRWRVDEGCDIVIEAIDVARDELGEGITGGKQVKPAGRVDEVSGSRPGEPGGSADGDSGIHLMPTRWLPLFPEKAAAHSNPSPHGHFGWAKHTILEQFSVTATEVYAEMKYVENTTEVDDGYEPDGYCYHSGFPFWSTDRCEQFYDPTGPAEVWVNISADFSHTTGVEYGQYAEFAGVPDDYSGACWLLWGSLPPLWSADCQYGQYY